MNSTTHPGRWLLLGMLSTFLTACGSGAPAGDPLRGKDLFVQCSGCHQLQENSSTGPKHCGLIGRPAGSVPGFDYSEAMKTSELTWDEKTLDEFLTMPYAYVTGTKMGFAGIGNATDRADVIAYLRQVGADPALCP